MSCSIVKGMNSHFAKESLFPAKSGLLWTPHPGGWCPLGISLQLCMLLAAHLCYAGIGMEAASLLGMWREEEDTVVWTLQKSGGELRNPYVGWMEDS